MVVEGQKELRFTRAGQAVLFGCLGAVFVGVAVTLLATGWYRAENPELPSGLWALPCLGLAVGLFWLARHLTVHAYVLLTPLGVEIFPFFRPAQGMQMVGWGEIVDAEVSEDGRWMTLHYNKEKTAGVHLSLRPIRREARGLLVKAVRGRVEERGGRG